MVYTSTTRLWVSTDSPAGPRKTIPLDDVGTDPKSHTVPDMSHHGESSVGYLIKAVSEVRMPAELERASITGFKELFSLEEMLFALAAPWTHLLNAPLATEQVPQIWDGAVQAGRCNRHSARGGSHSSPWHGSHSASCSHPASCEDVTS